MSSNIAEITGKMPFSGKSIVKYWYQKGREASRNGEMGGKVAYAAALGAFAVMHAVQLKMGVTELVRDGSQGPVNVGIDALYTTANAMATYTQAYLATRVLATPTEAQRFALSSADGVSADGAASRDRSHVSHWVILARWT
jgi:hypothetical protein